MFELYNAKSTWSKPHLLYNPIQSAITKLESVVGNEQKMYQANPQGYFKSLSQDYGDLIPSIVTGAVVNNIITQLNTGAQPTGEQYLALGAGILTMFIADHWMEQQEPLTSNTHYRGTRNLFAAMSISALALHPIAAISFGLASVSQNDHNGRRQRRKEQITALERSRELVQLL